MKAWVLVVQCGTYVTLGCLLLHEGLWKLGVALLLAGVQALVFS